VHYRTLVPFPIEDMLVSSLSAMPFVALSYILLFLLIVFFLSLC